MLFTKEEVKEILTNVEVLEQISGPIDYFLSEQDRYVDSSKKEAIAFICEYATAILNSKGIHSFDLEEVITVAEDKLTMKLQSLVSEYIAAGLHSFTRWKIFQ